MHRWALATSLALAACGGATPNVASPERTPVELALRRDDGSFIDVGDLRGRVVFLFLLGTYDGVSQMALTPLRAFAERHEDVEIVGIDIEPSARLLVGAYEHALEPPFPIAYDPEDQIVAGSTALGSIDTVPTIVALDAQGFERARHTGMVQAEDLEALLRSAR